MPRPEERAVLVDPREILSAADAGGRVVRGGLLRIAATIVNLAANLAGAILMIRRLGASAGDSRYGLFISLSALAVITLTLADGGLQQLGAREYIHGEPDHRPQILRDLLGIRVALLTPAIAVVALVAALSKQDATLVFGAVLAAGGQATLMVQQTMSVPLQTTLNLGILAVIDLVRGIAGTALVAVFYIANTGLLPYFSVQLLAGILAMAVMWIVAPTTRATPDLAGSGWRTFLLASIPFAVAAAAGVVYFRLGAWLIDLVSPADADSYAIAFRAIEALTAIPAILVGAAFPVIASALKDRARLASALQTSFDASLATGAPLALGVILAAPLATTILAHGKPGEQAAIAPLRLLGIALATSFLVYSWSYTLLALGRYRALTIVSAAAAIVVAVGCVALGRSYGATGTAAATILGELTVVVGAGIALRLQDPALVPNPRFALRVAVASGLGIIPLALGLATWLALPLGMVLYIVAALVLRAVPPQVLTALPGGARFVRG
jgi:O-antigen/teichoic acid export membrane protein